MNIPEMSKQEQDRLKLLEFCQQLRNKVGILEDAIDIKGKDIRPENMESEITFIERQFENMVETAFHLRQQFVKISNQWRKEMRNEKQNK